MFQEEAAITRLGICCNSETPNPVLDNMIARPWQQGQYVLKSMRSPDLCLGDMQQLCPARPEVLHTMSTPGASSKQYLMQRS